MLVRLKMPLMRQDNKNGYTVSVISEGTIYKVRGYDRGITRLVYLERLDNGEDLHLTIEEFNVVTEEMKEGL